MTDKDRYEIFKEKCIDEGIEPPTFEKFTGEDSSNKESISEDLLDEIHNQWEDYPHRKWPKCPYKDFKNIAYHFANWQKKQYINEGISPKDVYFGHLLEESWAAGRSSGIHEYKQQMMKDAIDTKVVDDSFGQQVGEVPTIRYDVQPEDN